MARGNGQQELPQPGLGVSPAEKCPEKEKSPFSCPISVSAQRGPGWRVPRGEAAQGDQGVLALCVCPGVH